MKYCIIYFHSGQIKSDFGQNGGFESIAAANMHAETVGLTGFTLLPFGNSAEWSDFSKEMTPSVCPCELKKLKTQKNDSKGNGAK